MYDSTSWLFMTFILQVYEELEAAAQYCEAGLPGLANEVEEALGEALEDLQVRLLACLVVEA
jgi:hypothetical protein